MSLSTTFEKLYSYYPSTATLIPYKDWVLVAYEGRKGIALHIFETCDSLEDFTNVERRFDRVIMSDLVFEDLGHAIKWGFEQIGH